MSANKLKYYTVDSRFVVKANSMTQALELINGKKVPGEILQEDNDINRISAVYARELVDGKPLTATA